MGARDRPPNRRPGDSIVLKRRDGTGELYPFVHRNDPSGERKIGWVDPGIVVPYDHYLIIMQRDGRDWFCLGVEAEKLGYVIQVYE